MKRAAAAAIALLAGGLATGASGGLPAGPRLLDLSVDNGGHPYAGDRRLLTTVTPNGDGFRDRARVNFVLRRPATVELDVISTDEVRRTPTLVATATEHFEVGRHHMAWKPTAFSA